MTGRLVDGARDVRDIDLDDVCFTARALAQSHPMTQAASRYRQSRFEGEREQQAASEAADWASTALLVGYCLRRAEERLAGTTPAVRELSDDDYVEQATAIAMAVVSGGPSSHRLLDAPITTGALDRLIATELDKRVEHVREQLDDEAWTELEEYIAWWVVHGYAVRTAETAR